MDKLVLLVSLGSSVGFSFLFPLDGNLSQPLNATNNTVNATAIADPAAAVNTTANDENVTANLGVKADLSLGTSQTAVTPSPAENQTGVSLNAQVGAATQAQNQTPDATTTPAPTQAAAAPVTTTPAPTSAPTATPSTTDQSVSAQTTAEVTSETNVTLPAVNVNVGGQNGVSVTLGL